MKSEPPERSRGPALSAAGIVLCAAWMGGTTEQASQGLLLFALGGLLVLAPAKRWPNRSFAICGLGLLMLTSTGFLPASWFWPALWRQESSAAGVIIPSTLSPQPWVTAQALLLLLAGLAWTAWLTARPWDSATRRTTAQTLAGAILLIALVALVAWSLGWHVPGWLSDRGFGPFPNRNHTGHLFAIGGVMALGCAVDAGWRAKSKALFWILSAILIVVALVFNYSRGGLFLFFGATGLWAAMSAWKRRSWKLLTLGLSGLLVVSALILLSDSPLVARFTGWEISQGDFRTRIWQDTLRCIQAAPWCGVGLGNFSDLFGFYRNDSVIQSSILHPESDWLWLATELGWPGVALALAGLIFLLRGAFPFERGTQRHLRSAALAVVIGAAIHGLIDVPAHRFGSLLAATMTLALARHEIVILQEAPPAAPAFWRILGLALIAGAVWWIRLPDHLTRAEEFSRTGRFHQAVESATHALEREPLQWGAYFTRAGALACQGQTLEALADFRRARLLEPHYARIPLEEGRFWMQREPELAIAPWREALNRVGSSGEELLFTEMLRDAPDTLNFRRQLLTLAEDHPTLQLLWFANVPLAEALPRLPEMTLIAERCEPRMKAIFQRRVVQLQTLR